VASITLADTTAEVNFLCLVIRIKARYGAPVRIGINSNDVLILGN